MHVTFNDININGKEIWEIEHHEVQKKKKKKNQLGFEIGLPVNDVSTIILK